ncbi:MAG: N-acetyl-gamma-glutamyl-phosphate reductase [Candidatus Omnitrophica bacterium]|nr:N-acetyl-gamma-glutamyl-phosphate reductase [Candidatus Omnitrophota bacterium]
MVNCAVVGATGYTGIELIKILSAHPKVCLSALTTRQKEPISVKSLVPSLYGCDGFQVRNYSLTELKKAADLFFICLPHTEAAQTAYELRLAGKMVIDLSADFRLKNASLYPKWYGVKHHYPSLLKKAVYGSPEMNRAQIRKADLIANPGCYPTASILAIYPLIRKRLIDLSSIVIDAKSGVSGAGKKLTPATQFCEVAENFKAYKVNCHQHTPEIEQTLSGAASKKVMVTFVPHLLPVDRGILATIYMKTAKGATAAGVKKAFEEAYKNEPFVRVRKENHFPALRDVRGTNFCDVGFSFDSKTKRLIVISAIDNLLKGASGQAVQNMNIRLGFDETEALLPRAIK